MSKIKLISYLLTFTLLWIETICDPQVPDIFDILKNSGNKTVGYKIVWEIDDSEGYFTKDTLGTSYSVVEYYDIENRRGRLDIIGSNLSGTFIYFEKTNETFHVNQGKCTLGNVNNKPDFLKTFLNDFWSAWYPLNHTILGPSALLRLIKVLSDTYGPPTVKFNRTIISQSDNRYFNGNLWNFTITNNDITSLIEWIFIDPSSPNPYGYQNMATPVKITVSKLGKVQKHYEVAQFTPYTDSNKMFMKNIHVPLELGCGRNQSAIKDAPMPPQLDSGVSYDMRLEVVMQPSYVTSGNEVNPSNLVDNGRLTYDDKSKLMAWRYDGFNSSGDLPKTHQYFSEEYKTGGYYDGVSGDGLPKGNFSLSLPTRTVWDMRSGVVYVIGDEEGDCTIKLKKPNDFLVSINFKSGYKIPINTPELIQSNIGSTYMGEFVERDVPVVVYEKRVDNMSIGFGSQIVKRTVVFTHYYAKDNYKSAYVGNDMLLKIGISILQINNNSTNVWTATINVNSFTMFMGSVDVWSHVKQQAFNVKNCFLSSGLSKWFQIAFPITTLQYYKMYLQADTIDRQILNYLYNENDLSISPTRIPSTLIGWASNTLYFSGLMLERAPFQFDFRNVGQQKLKDENHQYLVNSFQDCAARCLESMEFDCNYLSLCDNFMCIMNDNSLTAAPQMVPSNNCTTYQRNSTYSMPTMKSILNKLSERVSAQTMPLFVLPKINLSLHLANDRNTIETINLTAVQLKTGFNFGLINTLNDKIPLNNDRYKLKSVTHYKIQNNDKRFKLVKANGFLNCQQQCDDLGNKTCHSFSYCTTDQECILSTMHSLQLFNSTNNNTYVQKSDCALLYRVYASEYDRFGIYSITVPKTATKKLKTHNEEECAIACSTDQTFRCRSFDKCDYSAGPEPPFNCYLHITHYLENVKNETYSFTLDPNYIHCGHYSRKYASDFNVRPNMRYAIIDGKDRIRMTGLTVEQCAHQCVETESNRKCLGFSFCEGRLLNNKTSPQPVCTLSPTNDQNNTVFVVNDPKCEIYFKEDLSFEINNYISSKTEGSNGEYSSGAGAGVGIFMLLLGGFLAVVAIIVYNKRKAALNSV